MLPNRTFPKAMIFFEQHKPLETPHHDSEATSSPPTDGSFLCTTCSESFISSEGLKEHKRVAHVNIAARPPVPYSPMPCKFIPIDIS